MKRWSLVSMSTVVLSSLMIGPFYDAGCWLARCRGRASLHSIPDFSICSHIEPEHCSQALKLQRR